MAQQLDGCREKIRRAHQHVTRLDHEIGLFLRKQPYQICADYNPDTTETIVTLRKCRQPPKRFSVIAGEVVYQLRSALDHLVYALVEKNGEPHLWEHQFPILLTPADYRSHFQRMVKGVAKVPKARIEALQPFNWRPPHDTHRLWLLKTLNNADKHRLLSIVLATARLRTFGARVPRGIGFPQISGRYRVIAEDGAVVGTIKPSTPDMKVKVNAVPEVVFPQVAGAKFKPVVPLLKDLSDFVGRVVEAFVPDFK